MTIFRQVGEFRVLVCQVLSLTLWSRSASKYLFELFTAVHLGYAPGYFIYYTL